MLAVRLYADKAKARNDRIEAVFNNDIVGYDVAGDAAPTSGFVHVFSDDPADSLSRELARYVRSCAQRYLPDFAANPSSAATASAAAATTRLSCPDGFAAVRFTTPVGNLGIAALTRRHLR